MNELLPSLLIGLAAALGAIGGSFLKELLPALALEDWKLRKQLHAVVRKYRDPLILSANELIHRLDEIEALFPPDYLKSEVRTAAPSSALEPIGPSTDDPYFQQYKLESSVYRLCAFLGWLELFRQDIAFLDSGRRSIDVEIESALTGIRAALADGQLNQAPNWHLWRDALIFREQQRAIGETMIIERSGNRCVMGYAAFSTNYRTASHPWYAIVDRFLLDLRVDLDFRRERLHLLRQGLRELIVFLDPDRARVSSDEYGRGHRLSTLDRTPPRPNGPVRTTAPDKKDRPTK